MRLCRWIHVALRQIALLPHETLTRGMLYLMSNSARANLRFPLESVLDLCH